MLYGDKTKKVRLKPGGGGIGKVELKDKKPRLKTGSQMGDDARRGLSKPGYGK